MYKRSVVSKTVNSPTFWSKGFRFFKPVTFSLYSPNEQVYFIIELVFSFGTLGISTPPLFLGTTYVLSGP